MSRNEKGSLFNTIAPVYGRFYSYQKERFSDVIEKTANAFDLTSYGTILDVGCGTGALCSVLNTKGMKVTGLDPAEKMLQIAKGHPENKDINFILGNVLDGLPFADSTFDISIASHVAHGLRQDDRMKMYMEMARVTKHKVIIYDYNKNRQWLTSFVEWLERGDYFRFIEVVETELQQCFSSVEVLNVDPQAAWYICTV